MISAECVDGLQCLLGGCAPAGPGEAGDGCSSDGDCKSGFKCVLSGFAAECAPEGTGDVGADCDKSIDCFGGLTCTGGKCAVLPPGAPPFGLPTWPGVSCDPPASTDTTRAYFEVPGVTTPAGEPGDFFRLPFPNDVRVKNGKLDLGGFPTPGSELLGFDPVQIYVDALSQESAWGSYEAVIFRFSGEIDFASFSDQAAKKYAIHWEDITEGTPDYKSSAGAGWIYDPNPGPYLCAHSLSVRRPSGSPMKPGHTYAVYITGMGTDKAGKKIEASPHFKAMLLDGAPSDATLQAAHARFAPFRAYLKANPVPDGVINASVITVGNVRNTMQTLATTITNAAAPIAKNWVKCGGGATSPCPQAEGDRACGDGASPDYDEYHALVTLPIFQQGTAPYEETGGGIVSDAVVRSEDVCMAITVPKGVTPPTTGFPLAVFAHGTGGSFRSHVRPEVAGALAKATPPMAVLGFDQVQHGPRRGASTKSPNNLFFNFQNPAAARGNPQQGAADQLSIARFVAALDASAAETGGDAIKIDPGAIVFYGHSQGSTHGSLALPYSDTYRGAVLSGNGASLIDALLSKTQPVNISAAIPFVLADLDPNTGKLRHDELHPVLQLLQQWIDPADPVNFARATTFEPETGHTPKHLFQTYGTGDHYSPGRTMAVYALAAGIDLVAPDGSVSTPEAIGELKPEPSPLSGNVTLTAVYTMGVREYSPSGTSDGHFVAFDVPSATNDVARFLGMAAAGQVPQIGD